MDKKYIAELFKKKFLSQERSSNYVQLKKRNNRNIFFKMLPTKRSDSIFMTVIFFIDFKIFFVTLTHKNFHENHS